MLERWVTVAVHVALLQRCWSAEFDVVGTEADDAYVLSDDTEPVRPGVSRSIPSAPSLRGGIGRHPAAITRGMAILTSIAVATFLVTACSLSVLSKGAYSWGVVKQSVAAAGLCSPYGEEASAGGQERRQATENDPIRDQARALKLSAHDEASVRGAERKQVDAYHEESIGSVTGGPRTSLAGRDKAEELHKTLQKVWWNEERQGAALRLTAEGGTRNMTPGAAGALVAAEGVLHPESPALARLTSLEGFNILRSVCMMILDIKRLTEELSRRSSPSPAALRAARDLARASTNLYVMLQNAKLPQLQVGKSVVHLQYVCELCETATAEAAAQPSSQESARVPTSGEPAHMPTDAEEDYPAAAEDPLGTSLKQPTPNSTDQQLVIRTNAAVFARPIQPVHSAPLWQSSSKFQGNVDSAILPDDRHIYPNQSASVSSTELQDSADRGETALRDAAVPEGSYKEDGTALGQLQEQDGRTEWMQNDKQPLSSNASKTGIPGEEGLQAHPSTAAGTQYTLAQEADCCTSVARMIDQKEAAEKEACEMMSMAGELSAHAGLSAAIANDACTDTAAGVLREASCILQRANRTSLNDSIPAVTASAYRNAYRQCTAAAQRLVAVFAPYWISVADSCATSLVRVKDLLSVARSRAEMEPSPQAIHVLISAIYGSQGELTRGREHVALVALAQGFVGGSDSMAEVAMLLRERLEESEAEVKKARQLCARLWLVWLRRAVDAFISNSGSSSTAVHLAATTEQAAESFEELNSVSGYDPVVENLGALVLEALASLQAAGILQS